MLEKQEEGKNSQFLYGCNTDWNLNTEFIHWVNYWFKEYKKNTIVDLTFHKFEYNGVLLTQEQVIDKIIDITNHIIEVNDWWEIEDREWEEVLDLFKLVFPAMWW